MGRKSIRGIRVPGHADPHAGSSDSPHSKRVLAAITTDDGGASSRAVIRNNIVSWTHPPLPNSPKVHCIQIGNTADVTVAKNTCTGTPWDAIAVTTANGQKSQRIVIEGNTLAASGSPAVGGSGVVIYDDPLGGGISEVTISGNNISIAADDGVRLYSASDPGGIDGAQIVNNTILMVDQRSPGTRYGVDIEFSSHVTAS